MSPLGRGLASLIPRREQKNAKNMLEQIDSMEVLSEEPKNVKALRQQQEETSLPVKPVRHVAVEEVPEDDVETVPAVQEEDNSGVAQEEVTPEPEEEKPEITPTEPEPATPEEAPAAVSEEETLPEEEPIFTVEETEEPEEPAVVETVEKDLPPAAPEEPEAAPPAESAAKHPIQHSLGKRVERIPIGDIEVNPLQPRKRFDADDLADLVRSLEHHGMLQPIVVTKKEKGTKYQLIAGERRLRAARELKWDTVPAVVRGDVKSERNRLELALIENIQRQNLDPVEEALGYQRLSEEYGMTHEEIGERVGRSRVGITNIMRMLQLPAEIQRGLSEGKISAGHARAILMIPDEEKQLRFYQHLLEEGLTVRKAENRARRIQRLMINDPGRQKLAGRPALALKYEGPLQDKYGYNARVKFNVLKNRFDIVFHAHSEAEAEELVGRLMGTKELPVNVDADIVDDL